MNGFGQDMNNNSTKDRQQYNILILKLLEHLVHKYPDLRFGQLLYNYHKRFKNIEEDWGGFMIEEPKDTFEVIYEKMDENNEVPNSIKVLYGKNSIDNN